MSPSARFGDRLVAPRLEVTAVEERFAFYRVDDRTGRAFKGRLPPRAARPVDKVGPLKSNEQRRESIRDRPIPMPVDVDHNNERPTRIDADPSKSRVMERPALKELAYREGFDAIPVHGITGVCPPVHSAHGGMGLQGTFPRAGLEECDLTALG